MAQAGGGTSAGSSTGTHRSNARGPTQSVSMLMSRPNSRALPPSLEYSVSCKVVLQRRVRNMFVLSLAASFVALCWTTFDPTQVPGSLVNVVPPLVHLPVVFAAIVPVLVLRKRTLTTAPSTTLTRFSQIKALQAPSSHAVWLAYVLSAAPLSFTYTSSASWSSPNANFNVFFFHKGRDTYMLNERFVFLAGLHAFAAAVAVVAHVVQARSRVVFEQTGTQTIPARLTKAGLSRVSAIARMVVITLIAYYSVYIVARKPVLRFIITSSFGAWTRPFLYSMLRHNAAFSPTLLLRALASTTFLFAVWEATHVCFEVYATQPMLVSQFASSPNQNLISGLQSSDTYFQEFAFNELATLSLTNESRRKAIFTDIRSDVTRGAWADVSRECLLLVGKELQRVKRRGQPAASAAAAPASGSAGSEKRSSVAVKKEDVFRPARRSLLDKFASNGPASSASSSASAAGVQGVASAVSTSVSSVASRVPAIFQTANTSAQGSTSGDSKPPATSSTSAAVNAPVASATRKVVEWEDRLAKWAPAAWGDVMFSKSPAMVVEASVARRTEVIWAIRALANLLCASLTEDPYGVAQRDIPKILEAFVLYLDELDGLEKSLMAEAESSKLPERKAEFTKQIGEQVGSVQAVLREGIRQVVTDFEPYLSEFRFPTHVASKLQLLIDWG